MEVWHSRAESMHHKLITIRSLNPFAGTSVPPLCLSDSTWSSRWFSEQYPNQQWYFIMMYINTNEFYAQSSNVMSEIELQVQHESSTHRKLPAPHDFELSSSVDDKNTEPNLDPQAHASTPSFAPSRKQLRTAQIQLRLQPFHLYNRLKRFIPYLYMFMYRVRTPRWCTQ